MGWSAAWGVIAATFIGAAVAWFIAAVPTDSHLSVWPALGLALVGLVGIYCLFASQLSIWPFRHAPDRDVARAVFNSFEDRRVLYQAQNQLAQDFSGPIDPEEHLQAIRAACRKFVTEMGGDDRVPRERSSEWDSRFLLALGRMRAEVGSQIAQIAAITRVEIPEVLKPILPPEAENSEDAELPRLFSE